MSLQSRRELLINIRNKYKEGTWNEKGKILDGFVAATGYDRKYAIRALKSSSVINECRAKRKPKEKKYDESVRQALILVWKAANQICSKRLVPFLPTFVSKLEDFGHLSLPDEVRSKLLSISPATMDRLLVTEKAREQRGLCTTRAGSLLKHQIKVRTFADWNELDPGFCEADLVAHCGNTVEGTFLNTLVLTDIVSGWTEFFALLCKNESEVIKALNVAKQVLPFVLLGLDTDNGSEFINYELLKFCEDRKITFTRSRAYRKNDQAHVEEKNGSIVRRLIGYDRYEGLDAQQALIELYAILRLYVNFFQPSLKLLSKERCAGKVVKKYEKAQTPYQRVIKSPSVSNEKKERLIKQYKKLDPVYLLKELERLQNNFWEHVWQPPKEFEPITITRKTAQPESTQDSESEKQSSPRRYRSVKKTQEASKPRTWRTHKDPFEGAWDKLRLRLELKPMFTAKILLDELIEQHPRKYSHSQLRTLQRRVANWRKEQIEKTKTHRLHRQAKSEIDEVNTYISLAMSS